MMRFRALLALALFLPSTAIAQQAVLQGGTFTAGHFPVYAGSSSSNPVVIDSGSAPAIINTGVAGQIPYYAASGITLSGNPNLTISSGALTAGIAGSVLGQLKLTGSISGTVTLTPQTIAGTYNFNVPTTAGTSGQPLISGGGGSTAMAWGSLSGNTTTFATTSGALTSGHCVVADVSGNLVDNGAGCGGSGTVNSGTTAQAAYYTTTGTAVSGTSALTLSASAVTMTPSGAVTINPTTTGTSDNMTIGATTPRAITSTTLTATGAVALSPSSANVVLSPTGTGVVTVNPASAGTINNMTIGGTTPLAATFTTAVGNNSVAAGVAGVSLGSFIISGNTSGSITIKPQAAAGTFNFNLPVTAGTSGQPMISGGGGTTAMSWGSLSGNTTSFATTNGALTNGHCVSIDASGNFQDAGAACATGSGTVASGTAGQITYYASSTNAVAGNANANISGGALTLGVANSVIGKLLVTGSSSGTITIQPQAAAGTYNFNLPATAGTSGQPLISAGGGSSPMTFGTLTGNTTKFGTATGSFTSGNCINSDASGNLIDNGSPCGTGGSGTVVSGNAGQMAYYPSSTASVSGSTNVNLSGAALTLGVAASTTGQLKLTGSTSGTITITGQAAAGTYEFDLPITAGTSGQFLRSAGGAGAPMTWATAGLAAIAAQTSNFNAAVNSAYCIDTAGGAVTATLPASPASNDIILFVSCSNYSTNNLIISRNGNNVQGLAANMTVATDNASFHLIFITSYGWRLF